MNWNQLILGSLRILRRFKLRTLFMSIGVMLGVATLIAGNAVSTGAKELLTDQINQMFGPGTILVASRELKPDDLVAISEEMDQVLAFAPQLNIGEQEISYAGSTVLAAVAGYSANADYVWNRGVIEGRFFSGDDIDSTSRVALIGTALQTKLFGEESGLDQEIVIRSLPFEIVGILEPIGVDPHGEDRDMDVYVPITTAMRRIANVDVVGMAKFVVSNADLVDDDADVMSVILRDQHNIAEGEEDSFRIYTSKFAGKAAIKAKAVLGIYVTIAAVVVLLVAAVVISSIMLVVVRERVGEIGLRKALGATPNSIAIQFLFESTTVTVLSGLMGIALGLGVANAIASFYRIPIQLAPMTVLLAVLASILVGILSGIIPARRAADMDPVDALR